MHKVTEALLATVGPTLERIGAEAVVFDADVFESRDDLIDCFKSLPCKLVVMQRSKEPLADPEEFPQVQPLTVPNIPLSRTGQIKLAMLVAVAEKIFERGDVIVSLSGVQGTGRLDMLSVLKVGDEAEFFVTDEQHPLPPDVDPAVFERVLSIASELAVEGRESRPVGAIFVLGDSDKVLENSRQLVINPFHGYPETERNVLTGNLDETLKEFSAIDGAFVIRGDGVVLSAGRYLMPQGKGGDAVRSGLGARHESAAAVTRATDAVAIVLSQSTSTITVFNSGRVLTEIERVKGGAQGLRFKRILEGQD